MRNLLLKSTDRRSFMLLFGAGVNLSLGVGANAKLLPANDNDDSPDPAPAGGACVSAWNIDPSGGVTGVQF